LIDGDLLYPHLIACNSFTRFAIYPLHVFIEISLGIILGAFHTLEFYWFIIYFGTHFGFSGRFFPPHLNSAALRYGDASLGYSAVSKGSLIIAFVIR